MRTYSSNRKHALNPSPDDLPPAKRVKHLKSVKKVHSKQQTLTQLHFCIDQTILKACSRCGLSFTKGVPDDEALHRTHCAQVQRGMEWGREEEKETIKAGVVQVETSVKLKNGRKGRIISFPADVGGKIGYKLGTLLQTINRSLSSPPLTPSILQASRAYLFLLPQETASNREQIVGCVIAQRISEAMAIAGAEEPTASTAAPPTIDVGEGLFCHTTPLPTPLGIPRLFVTSTHRRQGIASYLLTAAANTMIYGCKLDPRKGEVAFTQPTRDGSRVMQKWGGGSVRIYEE
ncbi:uncharacterized protein LACBIDRAFT_316036 [Laccaria bicolor S238N-H82]|uniref:Predicted protein n=1 Tax=Laccaria bicolor (strain S238N-H82 / ATCC MYA-4686) TaxID=486041 RepID=B0D3S5_LACBS|nr:uncharacterized protein LACBIDRAFT_316036 [Laccaria bicolor S238N-H82]EDR11319.1 predicted protein [Laccaria bicolor S238N-H82]|eukprot:XP_001878620.1 predicted protein [Laccaria bicolor S238N-H82]